MQFLETGWAGFGAWCQSISMSSGSSKLRSGMKLMRQTVTRLSLAFSTPWWLLRWVPLLWWKLSLLPEPQTHSAKMLRNVFTTWDVVGSFSSSFSCHLLLNLRSTLWNSTSIWWAGLYPSNVQSTPAITLFRLCTLDVLVTCLIKRNADWLWSGNISSRLAPQR